MLRDGAAQSAQHTGASQHTILHTENNFADARESLEALPFFRRID
jgi:hypothetical protein